MNNVRNYTGWSSAKSLTVPVQYIRQMDNTAFQAYLEYIANIIYYQSSVQNNSDLDDRRNFRKCADALDTIDDIVSIVTEMDVKDYMIYTEFNGGRLVGFAVIRFECGIRSTFVPSIEGVKKRNTIYIQLICSIERGIGSKMMGLVEQLAVSSGYKRIELHPTKTSMEFYRKLGYSKLHRNKYTGTILYKNIQVNSTQENRRQETQQ